VGSEGRLGKSTGLVRPHERHYQLIEPWQRSHPATDIIAHVDPDKAGEIIEGAFPLQIAWILCASCIWPMWLDLESSFPETISQPLLRASNSLLDWTTWQRIIATERPYRPEASGRR